MSPRRPNVVSDNERVELELEIELSHDEINALKLQNRNDRFAAVVVIVIITGASVWSLLAGNPCPP